MDSVRIKKKAFLACTAAFFLIAGGIMRFGFPASASAEEAASNSTLAGVTLTQNSSYVSDSYFGVIHLTAADGSVACASVDSRNHVVVTAVGPGKTTIGFWYKTTSDAGWVNAALPVTVSGRSVQSSTVTESEAGLAFSRTEAAVNVGAAYTPNGIRVNGYAVSAAGLLWLSSSDSVASVEKTTGKVTGTAVGTATIYAIDPATKSCGSYAVKVQ